MSVEDRTDQTATAEGKQKRLRSASNSKLPVVSVIPDTETVKHVISLLKEAVRLKVKISESDDRVKEIQTELYAISAAYDLSGFRWGIAGFENRGYTSRQTLDKQALVAKMSEYGMPVSELDACYKPGNEYLDARVVVFDIE